MLKIKKNFILTFVFAITIVLSSCQSTKSSEISTSGDSYYDSEIVETENKKSNDKEINFAEMIFGKKFVEFDQFYLSTPTVTFSIKQKLSNFVYGVKSERFGFGSSYMAAYYYFTLDDAGRKTFRNAVDSYLKDFEEKKLERNSKKTERAYGFVNARLDWGSIKSSVSNYGEGNAFLGYQFKNKSPYFSITIYQVPNQKYLNGDDSVDKESLMLNYYFTKAQAKQLAEFLSDENIESILMQNKYNLEEETESEKDIY
ncbi:MAG: hypothetical protein K5829_04675 [Treponema sp.]|nr:hypothetical protein [Treponema sp.]